MEIKLGKGAHRLLLPYRNLARDYWRELSQSRLSHIATSPLLCPGRWIALEAVTDDRTTSEAGTYADHWHYSAVDPRVIQDTRPRFVVSGGCREQSLFPVLRPSEKLLKSKSSPVHWDYDDGMGEKHEQGFVNLDSHRQSGMGQGCLYGRLIAHNRMVWIALHRGFRVCRCVHARTFSETQLPSLGAP